MKNTVLIAGGSGLIGLNLLQKMEKDEQVRQVKALVRRKMESWNAFLKVRQVVVDFDAVRVFESEMKGDVLVCSLGTTIKKAKTKEAFYKVDHDYPLEIAKAALKNRVRHFVLISAVGADAHSKIFYNSTKGKLENDIAQLDFESIHIIRPSLLLGDRSEKRFGERIAQIISKSLSFLLPIKYRPIDINVISSKILKIMQNPGKGLQIYEGQAIYR